VRAFSWWLPAISWMCLIFFTSGRAGSAEHSRSLLEDLFGLSGYWLHAINGVLRKGSHVLEYAILTAFVILALRRGHGWSVGRAVFGGLIISVAYACSDEVHQVWVPNREGTWTDVLVDSFGVGITSLITLRRGLGGEIGDT